MTLKERQQAFDIQKWYDSILWGEDRCGTYDFCSKCVRDRSYPCARAIMRKEGKYIRIGIATVRRRV